MSAGKSLKDIYDAGFAKLLELEQNSTQQLNTAADDHGEDRKHTDDEALERVEARTGELETELRTFMAASIERLQKVMQSEIKETEQHLTGVRSDLTTLSDRLKSSIFELRKAYEENVDTLCMSLADGYEGTVEASTMELEKQDFASSKHLRANGTIVMNSLQQKLDHSLWESRGEEKQYNSSLFKAFMQKANSIDTHFSTLMQKLSADFQGHFKIVESQASQADPELNRVATELAGEIEGHATQIENDIRQMFQNVLEEHSTKLDNSLGAAAQDLSSVHDATTERLTEQTKQLSDSFVNASSDARDALTNKCTKLRDQIETSMQKFNVRLDEKLQSNKDMRSSLETEKKDIFEYVRTELEEMRDSFEVRLQSLMNDALARISNLALEAERDISEVYSKCDGELKRDGISSKSEVDAAVAEFLQLLFEQRNNALDLIARSAGGGADTTAKPQLTTVVDDQSGPDFDFTDDLDF